MYSKGMDWFRRVAKQAVVVGTLSLAACGGGGGEGGSGGGAASGGPGVEARHFPLAVGDRWVYHEWFGSDTSGPPQVTLIKAVASSTIQGRSAITLESYSTREARVLDTRHIAISDAAATELLDPSSSLPQAIDLLRFPLAVGQSFVTVDQTSDEPFDLDGDQRNERFRVVATVEVMAREAVQTDAGAFADAARVRTVIRQSTLFSSGLPPYVETHTIDEWYGPGIGLLRQDYDVSSSTGTWGYSGRVLLAGYSVGDARSERVAPQATLVKPNGLSGPFAGIELRFDETMDPTRYDTQAVELRNSAGTLVPVSIYSTAVDWTFHPSMGPLPGGEYTLQLTPRVTDLVGNAAAARSWTFTVDATAPAIVATSPAASARYVSLQPTITVDFSEEMAPATIPGNVYLIGTSYLPVDLSLQGRRLTITPRSPLLPDTEYTVSIQPGLTDTVGNSLGNSQLFVFRTDPGRFDHPIISGAGSSPAAVAIGDVNGDGRQDVVMTNESYFDPVNDHRLFIYLQGADGRLAAPTSLATRADNSCRGASVQVGDLNGDGRDDVAIGQLGCGIEIFLQNASGQLVSSTYLPAVESYLIRMRDMNGDGRLDLVGGGAASQLAVWLQQASGNMGAPSRHDFGAAQLMDLDIGDVNGDGRPDIVALQSSHTVAVFAQQADGSFGSPANRLITDTPMDALAVGDINGDGREDIVFTRWWGEAPGMLLQDASGNLGAAANLPRTGAIGSDAVEIVDVDGDGRKDVVVRGDGNFAVSLQQAGGAPGTFSVLHGGTSAGQFNPQSLAVGDINGDGRPDLVSTGIAVALNRGNAVSAQALSSKSPVVRALSGREVFKSIATSTSRARD